jgi:hypothetical protein
MTEREDIALQYLAEAVEELTPKVYCPLCGTEFDEWCDCGCYSDLMYGRD